MVRLPAGVVRAAVRRRRHLPDAAWPALLQLASLVADDVPVLGPPTARRVLCVAPHPDDEVIGCGGTLALLADRGAEVAVVVATDGEASVGSPHPRAETGSRRRGEAVAACAALGVPAPSFVGLPDGAVADHAGRLRAVLSAVRDDLDPTLVLAPWPLDGHPDHRAVAAAVATIVGVDTEAWGYEAHVPVTPTRVVDITAVVERKRTALAAHVTAGHAMELQATLGLNRWRSLAVAGGRGWAEAFLALPGAAWAHAVAMAADAAAVSRSPG